MWKISTTALAMMAVLASCGEKDTRLQGQREAVLPAQTVRVQNSAPSLALRAPQRNASWTHRAGEADHAIAHPALSAQPQELFAVKFGAGAGHGTRITAEPVIAAGRVFVMDAQANVVAVSPSGQLLWSRPLVPPFDRAGEASGGGLAYGEGKLFATSGFGELTAIDPATGRVLWVQDLDAPGGAAPTVRDGLVYVSGRDGTAWAIRTETGRIQWTLAGARGQASFGAGAAPAVSGDLAIMPFPGGELRAVFAKGGLPRWSNIVAGRRIGYAASSFSDITADPVISGDTVYSGNVAGRVAAIDLENGETKWDVAMAAKSAVWPAGNSVFLVNDLNQLVRLNAASGAPVWAVDLPRFAETRRRNRLFAHFGPVLAGGRLYVASTDGVMRQFDPRSGALTSYAALEAPAASGPAVANGVMYVVTTDGVLHAFR